METEHPIVYNGLVKDEEDMFEIDKSPDLTPIPRYDDEILAWMRKPLFHDIQIC